MHGTLTQAPDPAALHAALGGLLRAVREDAALIAAGWSEGGPRADFAEGAANLALRRRDLRPLQRALMVLGLSLLGRLEGRVLPMLRG